MDLLKKIFINVYKSIILCTLVIGCGQATALPKECENSILYQKIPNPEALGSVLRVANASLLVEKQDLCRPVYSLFSTLTTIASDPFSSYSLLYEVILTSARLTPSLKKVLLVSYEVLDAFYRNQSAIDPCDRRLLLSHFSSQLEMIQRICPEFVR